MSVETEAHKGKSRYQYIKERGGVPVFPMPKFCRAVISAWIDAGKSSGSDSLSWGDITAWTKASKCNFNPWVLKTIKKMSDEYVYQLAISRQADCPPPFGNPLNNFDRNKLEKKIRGAFGAFLKAKK